jgi:predicted  nucleic acid-binding Zn-ribbon protein
VSKPEGNGARPAQEAFAALETAVGRALERLDTMTRRAEAAEKKSAELNDIMRRFTGNPEEAGDLLTRLKTLEDENEDLRVRIGRGREGVERLMARVRFMENQ